MSGGTSKVFSVLYRVYHERMTVGWNRYLRQMPWLSQQNLSLRREDVPQKEQIHDWKMISDGAYGPFQYTAGESESKAGLLNDITELLDHGEEVSDQELNDIIEEIQSGRKELYDDTAAGIRDDLEDWTIIIIN